jgi:hypothetical protein
MDIGLTEFCVVLNGIPEWFLLDEHKTIFRSASFPISACLFELNFSIYRIKKINAQVLSIKKIMKST